MDDLAISIHFNDIDLLKSCLLSNPSSLIPLDLVLLGLRRKHFDLLTVIFTECTLHNPLKLYVFQLLECAIKINDPTIWQFLTISGCDMAATSNSYRPIHLLTLELHPMIREWILQHSAPLVIPDSAMDTTYFHQCLHGEPSLLQYFPPSMIICNYDDVLTACMGNLPSCSNQFYWLSWIVTHCCGDEDLSTSQCKHKCLEILIHTSPSTLMDDGSTLLTAISRLLCCGASLQGVNLHKFIFETTIGMWKTHPDQVRRVMSLLFEHCGVPPNSHASLLSASVSHGLYDLSTIILQYAPHAPITYQQYQELVCVPLPIVQHIIKHNPNAFSFRLLEKYIIHRKYDTVYTLLQSLSDKQWTQLRASTLKNQHIRSDLTCFITMTIGSEQFQILDLLQRNGFTFPQDLSPEAMFTSIFMCQSYVRFMLAHWASAGLDLVTNLYQNHDTNRGAMVYFYDHGYHPSRIDYSSHYRLCSIAIFSDHYGLIRSLFDFTYAYEQDGGDAGDGTDDGSYYFSNFDSIQHSFYRCRSIDILRFLITESFFDINSLETTSRGILGQARDVFIGQLLIDLGAHVNGPPSLYVADQNRIQSDVKLRDYINIVKERTSSLIRSPLHHVILRKDWPMVKFLIENGADLTPDTGRFQLPTLPLAIAAFNDVDKVRYVIEHNGGTVTHNDHGGHDALCTACKLDNDDIIRLLIAYGADITDKRTIRCLFKAQKLHIIDTFVLPDCITEWIDNWYADEPIEFMQLLLTLGQPSIDFVLQHNTNLRNQRIIQKVLMKNKTNPQLYGLVVQFITRLDIHFDPLPVDEDCDMGVVKSIMEERWDDAWGLIRHGAHLHGCYRDAYRTREHYIIMAVLKSGPPHLLYAYVKELIAYGVDLNVYDGVDRCSPTILAAKMGRWDIVALFIKHDAKVVLTSSSSSSSLSQKDQCQSHLYNIIDSLPEPLPTAFHHYLTHRLLRPPLSM